MNKLESKDNNFNTSKLDAKLEEQLRTSPGRVSFRLEMEGYSFQYNSKDSYSSASLIKIPILIEGFRQAQQGKINLDQSVRMDQTSKVAGAGVIQALSNQMDWKIRDLMTLMIIVSDNYATNVLIDLFGEDSINQCIKDIGLINTKLNRKMMDFESLRLGKDNYTSAYDMVECIMVLNESEFLSEESKKEAQSILGYQQFNQKLPALMDTEKVYVGNKTGELPGVNHDCAIVTYRGKHAYMALLIDQLPLEENSTHMMNMIGKIVYDELIVF